MPAAALAKGCLEPLMAGKVPAIRIPGFTDPVEAQGIAHRLAAHPGSRAATFVRPAGHRR